uniref:Proton-coupled folate transporter n=1 Tax=Timema poppense TaxID=170557 RepID=A0A7R9H380_TIMPO|nr:unnamed protein product [Timema poppensis]
MERGETKEKRFKRCTHWLSFISVEPVMFFYMFAFMLTSVVEQAFFVNKACQVNLGYSQEICLDLTNDNFTEENKKVQVIVSNFHQNNNIASHVVPIVLALVIGSWSDRRGRKLPLIMGLIGKLFYSIMVIISSTQDTWPLETIILAASLPSALTGSDLAIFMAAFSYLSDITTPKDRTLRVSILDVVYLATMPTGIALGKYLFNLTDRSYTIMFSLNASMLLIAILYTIARLEWRTTPSQQPLNSSTNCCTDFFDKEHVIQSVKTVIKKRPHHRRAYLIILFVSMALYTFQRDEKPKSYLYTILKFKWTADEYSDYRTFQSTAYVIGTLLGVPIMSRVFGLKDTVMVMVGAVAHASARIVFGLAEVPWLFYLGKWWNRILRSSRSTSLEVNDIKSRANLRKRGIHISLGSRKLEVEETECLATDQANSEID